MCDSLYVLCDSRITDEVLLILGSQPFYFNSDGTRAGLVLATDGYFDSYGNPLPSSYEMDAGWLLTVGRDAIVPRCTKDASIRRARTKFCAEVFTPLNVVSRMLDIAESAFFGTDVSRSARTHALAAEFACGEGPFLTSRYDPVTGYVIANPEYRVGIYDRKYAAATDASEFFDAIVSTFGFEYQGDNVLLARANAYLTWYEAYERFFGCEPSSKVACNIAKSISARIIQVDVLSGCIPKTSVPSLFHIGDDALSLYDAHFDYVVSNPPYQVGSGSLLQNFRKSVYCDFVDFGRRLATCSVMIHPARFLFGAGSTSKAWTEDVLSDEHMSVVLYEPDARTVFSDGVDIKGGVCITLHDSRCKLGPIGVYTPYESLSSIVAKVIAASDFEPMSAHMHGCTKFDLDKLAELYPYAFSCIGSNGRDKRMRTNAFSLPGLFSDVPFWARNVVFSKGVFGLDEHMSRVVRYVDPGVIAENDATYGRYKVLVPKASGSGEFGEALSSPVVLKPAIGYTESFIGVGLFLDVTEAEACYKYLLTKFARAMLFVCKCTQDNSRSVWKYVPWQDFSSDSDIDWTVSVAAVDTQLYAKYGLSGDEIAFVEDHVTSMEDCDDI